MLQPRYYYFLLQDFTNPLVKYVQFLTKLLQSRLLSKLNFLPKYYLRSENLWNDGFLFDFLQKKTVDAWVRQYVIYTGFLFSERIVFEVVVRLYNDVLLWPAHDANIFEVSNTSSMLNTIVFIYFTLFITTVVWLSLFI